VHSLLTYAHPSTLEQEPQDINELVHETLLLIEHQLKSWSNISVHTQFGSGLPLLICDRNQISQLLINLLNNSRDAMPKGGEISISTSFDPTIHRLTLEVSDTGPGVPMAIRSKIFDPFFTTQGVGKGTGLGLSIVSSIVHSYGGDITIGDATPRGAVFTIHLPLDGFKYYDPPSDPQETGRYTL
jgi:two-component system, NtrC family, sensor kinase